MYKYGFKSQGRRQGGGGAWGASAPPQFLTDQLTLSQPGRHIIPTQYYVPTQIFRPRDSPEKVWYVVKYEGILLKCLEI